MANHKYHKLPPLNDDVQAIILTAGEGARLGSWTINRPKGMIPVGNKPILEYLVRGLSSAGIKEINMVVGYGKNSVMSYFGDGTAFDANISYKFQEERTGTLDALEIGLEDIRNDFILVPGDNYVSADSFVRLRDSDNPTLLIGTADRWSKWGEIELQKGKPMITFDNPEAFGRIHFTGITRLNQSLAEELIKLPGKHIGESLQALLINHKFDVLESSNWHNIVYPWDLISCNRIALSDNDLLRSGKIERNVVIKGRVSIGKGSVVRSGSYISGPVSIGDGCDIGPNSVIGPSVSVGDNVMIGPFTEISDTIIMKNCEIGSHSSFEGTVVGDGTLVGSHSIVIPRSGDILYFDQTFSVSERGAMIGNECKIGSRAVLQGGSILLNGAAIGEGEFYNADFQGDNI